jgi:hypothetical protein
MKVKIEPVWQAFGVNVWFYQRAPDGMIEVDRPEAPLSPERVSSEAELPAPSLVLPNDWIAALVAEASDLQPPSSAQAAHLTDAVTVRDRLLTLVEHQHTS